MTNTIEAYVGDLGDAAADALLPSYLDAFDETRLAYAGGTDTETPGLPRADDAMPRCSRIR